MNSKFLFSSNGHVIRTRRRYSEVAWALAVCLALVLLMAYGYWRDNQAYEASAFAAGHRAGFSAGEQAAVDVLQEAVAAAYRQGRVDAAADLGTRGQL